MSIQTCILNEIREIQKIEQLIPQEDLNAQTQILSSFDWTDSSLEPDARQAVEALLFEFHNIFVWYRFDKGINKELEVQHTILNDRPAESQSLLAPINFKDDILLELVLLQWWGIVTTLPFNKKATPIFARRKPNGNICFFVELRKINTLIAHD